MDATEMILATTAELTARAQEAISQVRQLNLESIWQAARLIMDCLDRDSLVFTAGAGHSLGAVADTFYRAGGLACVYPLFLPELLPMNGAPASTRAERSSGLAARVFDEHTLSANDVLVIFSTSGVNNYPVELAMLARQNGTPVIAITSPSASANAPRRSSSTLFELADIVLDSGVPLGDTSFPTDTPLTAPLSSILNAALWNLVLGSLVTIAQAENRDLPLWQSANVEGGDKANLALFDRYRSRIPALA